MLFEEIIPYLRRGYKVRRREWIEGHFIYFLAQGKLVTADEHIYVLSGKSLAAIDWEVYKPTIITKTNVVRIIKVEADKKTVVKEIAVVSFDEIEDILRRFIETQPDGKYIAVKEEVWSE